MNGVDENLRNLSFESLLNLLQNILVSLAAHKWDWDTLGSETSGTTDTMKVRVGIRWEIVVDGEVDTFDINTTSKHIRGNANTLVEFLEFSVAFNTVTWISTGYVWIATLYIPFLLTHARMHSNRWEVTLSEKLV